jgi:MerR family transcriptional regulator, light-induced transcriptional regulator
MMVDNRHSQPAEPDVWRQPTTTPEHARSSAARVAEAYLAATLSGDRAEALRIIREEGYASGLSITQLYLDVIQHTQYEIGQLWEQGEVSVAQEHIATAISQLAMAQLYSMMPRRDALGYRVLITCVPGETHDMGPRILADFFEMAGFDVRYLGADVPTTEIIDSVRLNSPHLVALSATMSYNLPAFRETVEAIRAEFGDRILIAAGGQAFRLTPELLDELEISIRAANAQELVNQSKAALGVS